MPEWMKKEEEYDASERKNNYLIKNLGKFCNLLKHLRNEHVDGSINNISNLLKMGSLILFISCIVCSYEMLTLWICGLFILAALCFNSGEFISRILKNLMILFIFPLIMFMPYAVLNPSNVVVIYYLKMILIIIVVQIYIASTTVYDMAQSLKKVHFPNVIIFMIDIMIKYLNIITYIIHDILEAVIMRTVGKEKNKYDTIGGLFANVIFKTKRCGEDLYQAMECRGFTETYVECKSKMNISKADIIFLAVNIMFVVIYFYVRSY